MSLAITEVKFHYLTHDQVKNDGGRIDEQIDKANSNKVPLPVAGARLGSVHKTEPFV